MLDEVLSYREMCDREGCQTLQRGMNYRLGKSYSVILMSRRRNAPYVDRIIPQSNTIEYEGHDIARSHGKNPKGIDQPRSHESGRPTQNGLFAAAVESYKTGKEEAELVRVYEKLFDGVWSDKGLFQLVDYNYVQHGRRRVFKFYLKATSNTIEKGQAANSLPQRRIIPSEVKKEVWKRDKGRCVVCGTKDNLHFDHDIPYSVGGSSITAENVQLLCARHNISKGNKIQ